MRDQVVANINGGVVYLRRGGTLFGTIKPGFQPVSCHLHEHVVGVLRQDNVVEHWNIAPAVAPFLIGMP